MGALADVVAPPYDVIDDSQRAALLERSPEQRRRGGPAQGRGRRLRARPGSASRPGSGTGVLVRDPEPALWAHTQQYTGPGRRGPDPAGVLLPGPHRALRPRPGAPPRADPPRARRRTGCASPGPPGPTSRRSSRSTPTPSRPPGGRSSGATSEPPWAEVTDGDGTVHRIWRVSDPGGDRGRPGRHGRRRAADRRRPPPLRDDAGLRRGARPRRGRRRGAPLHPHVPGRPRGPGPDDLPHPPPRERPRRGPPGAPCDEELERDFRSEEVPLEQIAPDPGDGVAASSATSTAPTKCPGA